MKNVKIDRETMYNIKTTFTLVRVENPTGHKALSVVIMQDMITDVVVGVDIVCNDYNKSNGFRVNSEHFDGVICRQNMQDFIQWTEYITDFNPFVHEFKHDELNLVRYHVIRIVSNILTLTE